MASTVGQRIRELRHRRGLSQTDLVDGLSLSGSYVSLIEADRRQPRQRALEVIAERLGCTVEYLRTGRGGDADAEVELELRFAELALRSGDAAAARERFVAVAARAAELGDHAVRLEARWGLSRAAEALGDLEGAVEGFEELAREHLPATLSRTVVMTALCRAYSECGDLARAIEVGEEALAGIRGDANGDGAGVPNHDEAAELASTLVGCYYERGDLTRAHLLARSVIEDAERSGSSRARAAAYWNAALVAEARGELRSARVFTERALALYGESDNVRATALLRVMWAWLLLRAPHQGAGEAEDLLERALADRPEVGSPVDVAYAETELARCRLIAGDPYEAVEIAQTALSRLLQGPRIESARARAVLGDARLALGDVDAALAAHTSAALELAEDGASRQAAAVWRDLADALAELGRIDEAMVAYRRAADSAGIPARPRTVSVAVPGIVTAVDFAARR